MYYALFIDNTCVHPVCIHMLVYSSIHLHDQQVSPFKTKSIKSLFLSLLPHLTLYYLATCSIHYNMYTTKNYKRTVTIRRRIGIVTHGQPLAIVNRKVIACVWMCLYPRTTPTLFEHQDETAFQNKTPEKTPEPKTILSPFAARQTNCILSILQ
jgi:hypothetical protein